MRGATITSYKVIIVRLFQSTRPVRGATTGLRMTTRLILISIHAPRAGRDIYHQRQHHKQDISIHAPRAGRDCPARFLHRSSHTFQSTRPVRGATRSLRQTRQQLGFQSTRPVRGATNMRTLWIYQCRISIHAPRAGRDLAVRRHDLFTADFNPRAPCGARQQKYTKLLYTLLRQKAILRQFHAKRRLLKRFSTYKYRNTFLICSANRMGKICTLPLRTTRSLDLPEGMSACSQSARFCFRTFFPSSKTADYPALDP